MAEIRHDTFCCWTELLQYSQPDAQCRFNMSFKYATKRANYSKIHLHSASPNKLQLLNF